MSGPNMTVVIDAVGGMSARFDAAASPRLGGTTLSTSAPTAYQITLTHHQESVKVPLYRIFPVESAIHWVSVTPGGNLERDMTTGGAREVSGRYRIRRPGTSAHSLRVPSWPRRS